ncbi:MAG: transporter related protein [Streptosporangiaceae bacterium]|nr:transporter related protein [Streptosporangiaceae bacterium]
MIADISTIVAREMGVRRGGRWLLRPATFGIAGGVIGLTGSPGAGKSTLLATFATMRRPYVGALDILGYATGSSADLRRLRARIGYLPADFSWAAGLRVRDFVAYSASYKRISMPAVQAILERLELGDVAAMKLGMLPADVRLRAALAATCVHDPDLVLLDEPLTGVSEQAADELIPLLRSLAPTVLVTGPSAGHVAGWCDQVFALARGRLTELATRPRPVGTGGRGSHLPVGGQAAIFAAGDRTTGNRTARAVAVPETHSRLDRLPVGSGAGV